MKFSVEEQSAGPGTEFSRYVKTSVNEVSHSKTSFLLKRNGPDDLNKMISKFYRCKIGEG